MPEGEAHAGIKSLLFWTWRVLKGLKHFFFISNSVAKASALKLAKKLAKKLSNLLSNPQPWQYSNFFFAEQITNFLTNQDGIIFWIIIYWFRVPITLVLTMCGRMWNFSVISQFS